MYDFNHISYLLYAYSYSFMLVPFALISIDIAEENFSRVTDPLATCGWDDTGQNKLIFGSVKVVKNNYLKWPSHSANVSLICPRTRVANTLPKLTNYSSETYQPKYLNSISNNYICKGSYHFFPFYFIYSGATTNPPDCQYNAGACEPHRLARWSLHKFETF